MYPEIKFKNFVSTPLFCLSSIILFHPILPIPRPAARRPLAPERKNLRAEVLERAETQWADKCVSFLPACLSRLRVCLCLSDRVSVARKNEGLKTDAREKLLSSRAWFSRFPNGFFFPAYFFYLFSPSFISLHRRIFPRLFHPFSFLLTLAHPMSHATSHPTQDTLVSSPPALPSFPHYICLHPHHAPTDTSSWSKPCSTSGRSSTS